MGSQIAVYDEFRSQLGELREFNSAAIFDYEDPAGNKEARSHIYKLRQTKSAVDKARKEEKAASLEYGRQVDAQAKEIIGEIEAMILVHQEPLDEIEQREKDRQAKHECRLEKMRELSMVSNEDLTAEQLRQRLAELDTYRIGEHWEEFEIEAARVKEAGVDFLRDQISKREKYEAEQAELKRLRELQAEQERKDREAQVAKEAEERAIRAAEEKATAEREAAERRELELKLAAEKAEKERLEAEHRAARAEQEAKENAEREAREQAEREATEAERREANKRHAKKVNNAAATALAEGGLEPEAAKLAVTLIAQKKIPNVSIAY